jgi:23S rRNA pseudouridine1911/1915/1917 synthase
VTRDGPEPIVVPTSLAGERVDRALALITGWSRAAVADLVRAGHVLVDGHAVARSRRLHGGEVVEVTQVPEQTVIPRAEPVPLVVRHEDADVIVVAKPAGLVVHPGAGHEHGTLVHGLLDRYPEIAAVGDPTRPGIVHRLDRDTSGLMVVARSVTAYDALTAALAARTVDRRYLALVWGVPAAARGVVDAPIGRSLRRRTRMAIRASGRGARTAYAVNEELSGGRLSLLECRLETGRTHQIRVHLASIGHPVAGDAAYGGAREGLDLDRPFLHAAFLAFDHPRTGERVELAEALPEDLERVLGRLRAGSPDSAGAAG